MTFAKLLTMILQHYLNDGYLNNKNLPLITLVITHPCQKMMQKIRKKFANDNPR